MKPMEAVVSQKQVKSTLRMLWISTKKLEGIAPIIKTLLILFLVCNQANASTIAFSEVLARIEETNPLLLGNKEQIKAGGFEVEAAKLGWLPRVSATLESKPSNVAVQPSRALQIEQTLWDGGRIEGRITEAATVSEKNKLRYELQKEELFLKAARLWTSMNIARNRSVLLGELLLQLGELERRMTRRVENKLSPQIDLELVVSKINQAKIDKAIAEVSIKSCESQLRQLAGLDLSDVFMSEREDVPQEQIVFKSQSIGIMDEIIDESPPVLTAKIDLRIGESRLKLKEAEQWPELYLRATRSIGPAQSSAITGSSWLIGLRYTPTAGIAVRKEMQSLESQVASLEQTVESQRSERRDAISSDVMEIEGAMARFAILNSVADGSYQVYESYTRQFSIGRKTWIDLLNSVRELSQIKLSQAEARTNLIGAMLRVQIRINRDIGLGHFGRWKSTP